MVKKENGIESSYRNLTHMTAIVPSHPNVNIAVTGTLILCFHHGEFHGCILVNTLAREVIWRRLIVRISGRGESVIIGEVFFREQTIDSLSECICVMMFGRAFVPLGRGEVDVNFRVVLHAVNPCLRSGRAVDRWTFAGCFELIILERNRGVSR
jgi:hypothetical protein